MNNTNTSENKDIQLLQIHHLNRDKELDVLFKSSIQLSPLDTRTTASTRLVHLTTGDLDNNYNYKNDPFRLENLPLGQRIVFTEKHTAIGYLLHTLEIGGVNEQEVKSGMEKHRPSWFNQYREWQSQLTERKRKKRLLDLTEFRIENTDFVAELYLTSHPGTWRSTNLSREDEKTVNEIKNSIDPHPQHCYRNAQKAALQFENDTKLSSKIKYVEGIALPKTGGQAIPHAWLEIKNEVAEITWPWHFIDGAEAVYFGREAESIDQIKQTRNSDIGGSIFLSETERKKMANLKQNAIDSK